MADLSTLYRWIEVATVVIAAGGVLWKAIAFIGTASKSLTTDIPHIGKEMAEQTGVLHAQTSLLTDIRDQLVRQSAVSPSRGWYAAKVRPNGEVVLMNPAEVATIEAVPAEAAPAEATTIEAVSVEVANQTEGSPSLAQRVSPAAY
jgi:hypothetical protein